MWKYKDVNITSEDGMPPDAIGFVYKIVHIPSGKYYIGKKSITSTRRIKLGKRELATIKEVRKSEGKGGRLPTKKTVKSSSDWETYYSSSEWIKEQVKAGHAEDFTREILQFCTSKKSLSYWEVYWQFKYDVLSDDNSLNENVNGKWYRRDIK